MPIILFISLMCVVVSPESTTVLLGEEASFSCSGEALAIIWTINRIGAEHLDVKIEVQTPMQGVFMSTITINGSAQYNNASIQCVLIVSPTTVSLPPPVFLTVLGKS